MFLPAPHAHDPPPSCSGSQTGVYHAPWCRRQHRIPHPRDIGDHQPNPRADRICPCLGQAPQGDPGNRKPGLNSSLAQDNRAHDDGNGRGHAPAKRQSMTQCRLEKQRRRTPEVDDPPGNCPLRQKMHPHQGGRTSIQNQKCPDGRHLEGDNGRKRCGCPGQGDEKRQEIGHQDTRKSHGIWGRPGMNDRPCTLLSTTARAHDATHSGDPSLPRYF